MTGTQMDRLDYGQWRNDGVAAGPGWLRNASDYGACEGTCRKNFLSRAHKIGNFGPKTS